MLATFQFEEYTTTIHNNLMLSFPLLFKSIKNKSKLSDSLFLVFITISLNSFIVGYVVHCLSFIESSENFPNFCNCTKERDWIPLKNYLPNMFPQQSVSIIFFIFMYYNTPKTRSLGKAIPFDVKLVPI